MMMLISDDDIAIAIAVAIHNDVTVYCIMNDNVAPPNPKQNRLDLTRDDQRS